MFTFIIRNLAVAASLTAAVCTPAFSQDESQASLFGPDDTVGAINLITPTHVLAASELVTSGKVYSLGITTGSATPAFGDRSFSLEVTDFGAPLGENAVTAHDDRVVMHIGIGSQIDGLAHIGDNFVHYNGHHADDFMTPQGVKVFGMESLPPIVTRGVLIDIAGYLGVDRLPAGKAYNSEEIEAAAKIQGVVIRSGDVVLLHTGWMSIMYKTPDTYLNTAPGLGTNGAAYLAELGVVAVGSDTNGLEVKQPENPALAFPVHQFLLAHRGVYILENINTAQLAADKAYEFMFVLGQPKLEGAVQAVINPIAIR